eukprot:SAG11_NODE_1073_length_5973_cov_34.243616_1_plen_436_part_00
MAEASTVVLPSAADAAGGSKGAQLKRLNTFEFVLFGSRSANVDSTAEKHKQLVAEVTRRTRGLFLGTGLPVWFQDSDVFDDSKIYSSDHHQKTVEEFVDASRYSSTPLLTSKWCAERYFEQHLQNSDMDMIKISDVKVSRIVTEFLEMYPSMIEEPDGIKKFQYGSSIRKKIIAETKRLLNIKIRYVRMEETRRNREIISELKQRVEVLEEKEAKGSAVSTLRDPVGAFQVNLDTDADVQKSCSTPGMSGIHISNYEGDFRGEDNVTPFYRADEDGAVTLSVMRDSDTKTVEELCRKTCGFLGNKTPIDVIDMADATEGKAETGTGAGAAKNIVKTPKPCFKCGVYLHSAGGHITKECPMDDDEAAVMKARLTKERRKAKEQRKKANKRARMLAVEEEKKRAEAETMATKVMATKDMSSTATSVSVGGASGTRAK